MEFLNSQLPGESKLEDLELVGIRDYFNSFELELDPIVVSYKQLTEFVDKGKVERTLSSFYCAKDPDIQDFVRCNME
ncbi:TPA: hypothetical protein HA351_08640, partial [Methanosarcinaceae archaeon]|nr:hypothetical protein [Methanosarcinaceae archaeon]